jgi:flagellar motility protein MotE (MotC chaperone)
MSIQGDRPHIGFRIFWGLGATALTGSALFFVLNGHGIQANSSFANGDKEEAHAAAPAEAAAKEAAPSSKLETTDEPSIPEASAIEDLRKQRASLDARMKEVAARESELDAKERALNEEFKKLAEMRDEIAKIDGARKKENDEKVNKLVETIEAMSPKSSSQLLSSLDETLAVAAISKISTARLAKIMNVMEPGRSSRLTEIMAGVVRAKAAPASNARGLRTASNGAAAATQSEKGGEYENGQNINNASTGVESKREPSSIQKK